MYPELQNHESRAMESWIHGTAEPLMRGTTEAWICGTTEPCIHGTTDSWNHSKKKKNHVSMYIVLRPKGLMLYTIR